MLGTLRHYARLYVLIEAQYIKARMQYRADFLISAVGMVFSNAISLVVFWALFHTIPRLDGWSFEEILFIYGFYLLAVSPAQIFFDHVWTLRIHVLEGTFIKYYFRPLNMFFYYLSEMFDLKGLPQVAVGLGVMIYASVKLGLMWDIQRIFLLVVMLVGASTVVAAMLTIAACSSFWIMHSYSILNLAFKLREYSQYPITIFDGVFRFLFTYILPIGFVAFYPSQLFLRPEDVSWLAYLSPLVGIVAFAVAYQIWTIGVDNYTGTGS